MARRARRPIPAEDSPRQLAHNPQKLRARVSEGQPDAGVDATPGKEPGVSIDAEEVGTQFLRDATEQDNFESEQALEVDHEAGGAPLGQMISQATLRSSKQTRFEVPVSGALSDDAPPVQSEPAESEVDLTSNAIVQASLFDRPAAAAEEPEEQEEQYDEGGDELSMTLEAPLRGPRITSDDPSEVDERKRRAIQRALDERVKKRLRVDALPKETGKPIQKDRTA